MKTIVILIAAFVILTAVWGNISLTFNTTDIAKSRMIWRMLGDRFKVHARFTPQWGAPERIGQHCYCSRVYAVRFSVGA